MFLKISFLVLTCATLSSAFNFNFFPDFFGWFAPPISDNLDQNNQLDTNLKNNVDTRE